EDAAHDDRVVRGIVVSQAVARMVAAPGHLRASHQPVKESGVQIVKDLFQVVMQTFGAAEALAAARLADEMGLGRDFPAAGKFAKARGVFRVNLFAVELGNQDVKEGMEHRIGRALQQVRDANENASLTQPDGVVQVSEREEQDLEIRDGSAWK